MIPTDLDELVARSTVVVRATVRRLHTYLSPDQDALLTDYEVLPQQYLAHSARR